MYVVDCSLLTKALIKITDLISVGDTSANPTMLIKFSRSKLKFAVQTSAGTYEYVYPVNIEENPPIKTAIVSAESLLSYIKGKNNVTITPKEDTLLISAKRLKANLVYIGNDYEVTVDKPESNLLDTSILQDFVLDALNKSADMKDRVEQKNRVLANLVVSNKKAYLVSGDSHHIVMFLSKTKIKDNINVTLQNSVLKRAFSIQGNLAILDTRVVSYNDEEYISLNASAEDNMVSVENVLPLYEGIPSKYAVVDTNEMLSVINTISSGTDTSTSVTINASENKCSFHVKTGSSSVSMSIPSKGHVFKTVVNLLHLTDCLKTLKSTTKSKMTMHNNMLCFMQEYELNKSTVDVFSAIATMVE